MLATMLRTPSSLKTVSLRLQAPRFFSTYTELEEGKETLASITKASPKVLAYFTASWCGPCKAIAPVFTTLAKDHGADVKFVKIDIDDNGTTSEQAGISSVPTFQSFHNGKVTAQFSGANKDGLTKAVQALVALK